MTTLAIFGAAGRMGQALIRCAAQDDGLRVLAAIEQTGHPSVGKDAGRHAGAVDLGLAVTDDARAMAGADVAIDFTFHSAVPAHVALAAELGVAVVLGTTGLTEEESACVRRAAEKIPLLWAPNMSLGMNLLFALVERTAAALGEEYDIEIVETHHRHKKDAPSGTALRLGEKAAQGRGRPFDEMASYGRHGLTGERVRGEIAIHSVRAGDAVGDHTVLFATDGERLELSHRATNRDTFVYGALHAAKWLRGQPAGLYDMKAALGLT